MHATKNENHYALRLIEASLDPLVTISAEGKITYVNEASIRVTGVSRIGLIGTNFSTYFTEPEKAEAGYQKAFDKGFVSDYALTIKHKNGKLTDVLYNASVYKDDEGNVLGVFAAARDVTDQQWAIDLREANKKLVLQTIEKEKRVAELSLANKELLFQNEEKEKRANELANTNKTLNRSKELLNSSLKEVSEYKEALYKTTIIAITDQKGIIKKVNSNFCEISKYKEEELIGKDHRILNSGYHSKTFIRDLWGTIANGKVWKGEIKNKAKDGTFYWVDTTIIPFLNTLGKPYQYLAIRLDITQQKESEKELISINKAMEFQNEERRKRSEEMRVANYARSLIEASRDPLFTISPEGKITDLNQATVRVTEKTREQLIGTYFSNYFTDPAKAKAGYEEVFEKDFVVDYPLTITDGTNTDVFFNGSVYKDDKKNVVGAVVVARDITEQKRFERDLIEAKEVAESNSNYARSLIEASRDPLVTIDGLGKITDVNEASIKVTGVSRKSIIGTNFSTYFTDPHKAETGYEKAFKKGFVSDYSLTIKHKNGKLTDVLYNASVYKDKEGNVLGVFASARDVTDQKKIQLEHIKLKELAELTAVIADEAKRKAEKATKIAVQAVKAKQQFLSNMSHEIRTPMNAIIGFTKVILKTELTSKQQEYLKAIKVSGDAMIVLINDILDLAKVDSGQLLFEETPFKIESSIAAMLHLFELKIQEKNLNFVREYDNNIPEVIIGDPMRLHQIILNLVSNAVKFTTNGEIKVSTKLISQNDEKVTILFSVQDTGIGITKDKIKEIFENFQQASSETSRIFGGTGLGLAIVKQLVESQGGEISVRSKLAKGSTFSFTLSFLKTNKNAVPIEEIIELDKETKNVRVLVVEDIPLNQLLMKTLLDDFGFTSDIASNGSLAIDKLNNSEYDIILMDLQMPIMNGFEATKYIREKMNITIPIMALTADVTTVDIEKCTEVGMNDYLSKPIDDKLLYSKIVSLVKNTKVTSSIEKSVKKEIAELKLTDMSYLNQKTKSNPALMMEMIALYLEQTPLLVSEMSQSFKKRDWGMLQSVSHKMIPSFSIFGMKPEIESVARMINEFSNAKEEHMDLSELIDEMEKICNQACKELEEEYQRIKNT
jgi:PAS domain S-box-containing protein